MSLKSKLHDFAEDEERLRLRDIVPVPYPENETPQDTVEDSDA